METTVAEPERFQSQQGERDINRSDIPGIANILDGNHNGVRQHIAECKAEEEE